MTRTTDSCLPGRKSGLRQLATAALLFLPAAAVCAASVKISLPPAEGTLCLAPQLTRPVGADRWDLVSPDGAIRTPVETFPCPDSEGAPARDRAALAAVVPKEAAQAEGSWSLQPHKPAPGESRVPRFRFTDASDATWVLWEGARPVFAYNHGFLLKPGVPESYRRSSYIHPLYGLDGEVLTDDFPKDHYHHRGVFWTWPHVWVNGRSYDPWTVRDMKTRFERCLAKQGGAAAAVLAVENGWYAEGKKVMRERVWIRVYRAAPEGRFIDIDLFLSPTESPVKLAGAENKGYGGLTIRFAPRLETTIATPLGDGPKDLLMTRLPWADLTGRLAAEKTLAGAAIFVSPDHPDFPPMWLTRHYGALCVGWPGVEPKELLPGRAVRCSYRLWIHRGGAGVERLRRLYGAYQAAVKTRAALP
ncbi:MAG: PmoA family protein [Verrucomicrobia bacterium]|nr:PmoA family protein [Verrucomicrobiota bacterium]